MLKRHDRILTLLAAAMVGMANSTGLAPPPPIMIDEEIEWLAPGIDDDSGLELDFVDHGAAAAMRVDASRVALSGLTRAWNGLSRILRS